MFCFFLKQKFQYTQQKNLETFLYSPKIETAKIVSLYLSKKSIAYGYWPKTSFSLYL